MSDSHTEAIWPRWLRLAVIVSVCLGVFFRLYNLDGKVIWEDELFGTIHLMGYTEAQIVEASPSFTHASGLQAFFRLPDPSQVRPSDVSGTIHSLALEDPQHPPLFYVTEHLWVAVFGNTVAAMRALPALFGILAFPCMYFLCLELFASRKAALLGVAVLAVSPFHVLYAQELREYSLWTVAVLLTCLTFLRAVRKETVLDWAFFGATLAVGMYIYPFTGLVAAGAGLFLVFSQSIRNRKVLLGYLTSCAVAFALFLPWLRIMVQADGLARGMHGILTSRRSTLDILASILRNVRAAFFDYGLYPLGQSHAKTVYPLLTLFLLACIGYAIATLGGRQNKTGLKFALIALCLPLAVLPLHDAFFGGILILQSRYFTPAYLAVELLIAAGLCHALSDRPQRALEQQWIRIAVVALLAGGTFSCVISSQAPTWSSKDFEQNRSVAEVVNRASAPLVVSDLDTSRILGLGYYLDPRVRVKLSMRCDQCAVPDVSRTNLMQAAAGSVFLLGPSAELRREALDWAQRAKPASAPRIIGVEIFADHRVETNPLMMFAPI